MNMKLKMPKILEPGKNILRLRKGEELLFWILHKIMEIICFSANVLQCNIAYSIVYVQLHYEFFYLLFIVIFLSCQSR